MPIIPRQCVTQLSSSVGVRWDWADIFTRRPLTRGRDHGSRRGHIAPHCHHVTHTSQGWTGTQLASIDNNSNYVPMRYFTCRCVLVICIVYWFVVYCMVASAPCVWMWSRDPAETWSRCGTADCCAAPGRRETQRRSGDRHRQKV